MKILVVHNRYRQPGGEDVVFEQECALLRTSGCEVLTYERDNQEGLQSKLNLIRLPATSVWSSSAYKDISKLVERNRPDIAHFHNTFPQVSPSAYYACARYRVPVIQSLHNPRLLCLGASQCLHGKVCEECQTKVIKWPGVLHKCYRSSAIQSASVAVMLAIHQSVGTWHRRVNRYIVATEFYKRKFVASGLPADRISVKPHFIMPDPGARDPTTVGDYALFIGRLDPEKGINTVLDAWKGLQIPLKVRADKSRTPAINSAVQSIANIQVLPRLTRPELYKCIAGARFLLWPSEGNYETFGLVAAEAFACGVPVISSDCGIASEIVANGKTGMHFRSGDAADLRRVVTLAWEQPALLAQMGRLARLEFEAKYTAAANADALLGIYASVLGQSRDSSHFPAACDEAVTTAS